MTKIEQRLVVEYGIELDGVWLPLGMLRRLDEHGPWSTPFTEATSDQAEVLLAHGLAQRQNAGLCRGNGLRNFVDAFPFEPTMPFSKLAGGDGGASQPDQTDAENTRRTRH
jgi:hypothetical protein